MSKMEIELTSEQMDKVEILKSNGMSVGDAIDALFEVKEFISEQNETYVNQRLNDATKQKEELEAKLNEVNDQISLFTKLKDTSLDVDEKTKMLEKEYAANSETYDKVVQDKKHDFKWSKKILKF